MHPLKKITKN